MWAGASLPMAQTPAMPERNGQVRGVAARPHHGLRNTMRSKIQA
jgi:hypothetical protein